MKKGLAIIEANEVETRSIFVDQDALECARLNALVRKRIANAEAKRREADRNHRKAEKAKARRREYALHAAGFVLSRLAVCVAVVWVGTAEMIHPAIYIPVALFNLCAACLRLGAWSGKVAKK